MELALAEESRGVKVFIYDLVSAGFVPPLDASDATSAACSCQPSQAGIGAGNAHDPCNNGLGQLRSRPFAAAYQGNFWGNHRSGSDIVKMMRARLADSDRVVTDPAEADLFFVPVEAFDACYAKKSWAQTVMRECGTDYKQYSDLQGMWRWLLQQDTFRQSDGSNHFIFAEFPLPYLDKTVRSPQAMAVRSRASCDVRQMGWFVDAAPTFAHVGIIWESATAAFIGLHVQSMFL